MRLQKRNSIELEGWIAEKLEEEDYVNIGEFDCGNSDLNEFFHKDALAHKKELLAETYSLRKATKGKTKNFSVAFISFSNDTIELTQEAKAKILPERKRYKTLPAVKIGRLGVDERLQGHNIGTLFINMAKKLFLVDNRTGCRFMTVDAYNEDRVIKFYE